MLSIFGLILNSPWKNRASNDDASKFKIFLGKLTMDITWKIIITGVCFSYSIILINLNLTKIRMKLKDTEVTFVFYFMLKLNTF